MGEINESIQELLTETFEQIKPSPEFKQRLYQQLAREARRRRQPVGWLTRVRTQLAGPGAFRWSLGRRATAALVGLALLVLVGGVVWAVRDQLSSMPRPQTVPGEQATATPGTATTHPPASPTSTATQLAQRQPRGLAATPAEPRPVATMPPPVATSTPAPTATTSPAPTSTSVPAATASPIPASTSAPTATTPPTAASMAEPLMVTSSPVPTQTTMTSIVSSPTTISCQGGRIVGVAWMDVNGNGQRDADDRPLGGVTVTLKDAAGQIVRTATTGGGGRYGLDNLPAGTYSLHTATTADHQAITARVWGVDLQCATITIDFGYRSQP